MNNQTEYARVSGKDAAGTAIGASRFSGTGSVPAAVAAILLLVVSSCITDNGSQGSNREPQRQPTGPFTIFEPNGGETFRVGDSMRVVFYADTARFDKPNVDFSPDTGKTWFHGIGSPMNIEHEGGGIHSFVWAIPDSFFVPVEYHSTVSSACMLVAHNYGEFDELDYTDETFEIVGR